jgi:hypothetical protein
MCAQVSDIPFTGGGGGGGEGPPPPPPPCLIFPGPGGIFLSQGSGGTLLAQNTTTEGTPSHPWSTRLSATSNQRVVLEIVGGLGNQPKRLFSEACTAISYRVFQVDIENASQRAWNSVNVELESVLGIESTHFDGLSFGKVDYDRLYSLSPPDLAGTICEKNRAFPCSSLFKRFTLEPDPRTSEVSNIKDKLHFIVGAVPPRETATIMFLVTQYDVTNQRFYLIFSPNSAREQTP